MSLSISNVVSVTVLVSATPLSTPGFGKGLFLGRATVLSLQNRVASYTKLTGGVDVDFNSTTEEYKAAQVYFAQSPAPKGPFKIGRQFLAAQAGVLKGGTVSSTIGDYTGITNGGFDITINGVNRQIFALDFSAQTLMTGVATVIQTKLAAALASTTCTWDSVRSCFVITSPTTGTSSLVGFASAPTGGSSPTDQSTLLGFTSSAGGRTFAGIAIESLTAALVATRAVDGDWYGLSLPVQATVQDNKDAMAFAESTKIKFWCTTADANCFDSTATSDLMFYAKNLSLKYTKVIYSTAPYAAMSAEAREHSIDFRQPNSTITLEFKQMPLVPVEPLNDTQIAAIKAKNGGVYVSAASGSSGFAMLTGSRMANGQASDEVLNLDAFSAEWQTRVFNALATNPTKVPQTDQGVAALVQAGDGACKQFVLNAAFAPGFWKGAPVGTVNTGDFLERGYYQFAQPVASQSDGDRAARLCPPITVIGIGAGAIESVAMTFIFQR